MKLIPFLTFISACSFEGEYFFPEELDTEECVPVNDDEFLVFCEGEGFLCTPRKDCKFCPCNRTQVWGHDGSECPLIDPGLALFQCQESVCQLHCTAVNTCYCT